MISYVSTRSECLRIANSTKRLWTPSKDLKEEKNNFCDFELFGSYTDNVDGVLYFDQIYTRKEYFIYGLLKTLKSGLFFIHGSTFFGISEVRDFLNSSPVAYLHPDSSESEVDFFIKNVFGDLSFSDSWGSLYPPTGVIVSQNYEWVIWASETSEIATFGAKYDTLLKIKSLFNEKIYFLENRDIEDWYKLNIDKKNQIYPNYLDLNFVDKNKNAVDD